MAWPRVKDKMVKVDSDDTTRIGLLNPSIPFSLGLVVFSASNPFGLWHRSADTITGTRGRRRSP